MSTGGRGAPGPSRMPSKALRPSNPEVHTLTKAERQSKKSHDQFAAALQQAQDIESGAVDEMDFDGVKSSEEFDEEAAIASARKAKKAALVALIVTIVALLSWVTLLQRNYVTVGSMHPLHKLRGAIHNDLPSPVTERALAEKTFNCSGSASDSFNPSSPNTPGSQSSRVPPKKVENTFLSFAASERMRCRRIIQSAYDLDKGRILTSVRLMLTSLSDKWRHAIGSLISSAARVEREMRRRKFEAVRIREEEKKRKKAEARNQTYISNSKPTEAPILAEICPTIPSISCTNRAAGPIQFRIYHAQGHCTELERFGALFGGISGENGGFKCHPCDPTVLDWWPALRTESRALNALSEFHATMGLGMHAPCMQWTGTSHRNYPFVAFLSHNYQKVPQFCEHLTLLGNDGLGLRQRAVTTLTEEIEELKLKMQLDRQRESAIQLQKLHSKDDVDAAAAGVAAVAAAVVKTEEEDESWDAHHLADMEDNLERVNNHEMKLEVDMPLHARYAGNPYSNPSDAQNMAITRDDTPESQAHNPMADQPPVPTSLDWYYPSEAPFIFNLYPLPDHWAGGSYDEENVANWLPDVPERLRAIMPDLYDIHYESLRVKVYGWASHMFIDYESFRHYAKFILQHTMYQSTHKDCDGPRCMGYWLERSTNVYFAYMDGYAMKANIDARTCTYNSFYSTSDSHAGRPMSPVSGFRERIDLIHDLMECHTRLDWTPPNEETPEAIAARPKKARVFEPPAPGTHQWFPEEEWITMEELATHVKPKVNPIARNATTEQPLPQRTA